jgi:hypothetical protein
MNARSYTSITRRHCVVLKSKDVTFFFCLSFTNNTFRLISVHYFYRLNILIGRETLPITHSFYAVCADNALATLRLSKSGTFLLLQFFKKSGLLRSKITLFYDIFHSEFECSTEIVCSQNC